MDGEHLERTVQMSGGRHYDQGKLRLDLITPEMQVAQAAVLTYGADKYGDNNWEQGMPWNKLFGSALRHLYKWWAGEEEDPESGLPHLWHAYCNVGFLLTYAVRKAGTDNRDGRSCYPWSDPVGISEAVDKALEETLYEGYCQGCKHPMYNCECGGIKEAHADVKRAEEVLERETDNQRIDDTELLLHDILVRTMCVIAEYGFVGTPTDLERKVQEIVEKNWPTNIALIPKNASALVRKLGQIDYKLRAEKVLMSEQRGRERIVTVTEIL
jgi:hypothetical protein